MERVPTAEVQYHYIGDQDEIQEEEEEDEDEDFSYIGLQYIIEEDEEDIRDGAALQEPEDGEEGEEDGDDKRRQAPGRIGRRQDAAASTSKSPQPRGAEIEFTVGPGEKITAADFKFYNALAYYIVKGGEHGNAMAINIHHGCRLCPHLHDFVSEHYNRESIWTWAGKRYHETWKEEEEGEEVQVDLDEFEDEFELLTDKYAFWVMQSCRHEGRIEAGNPSGELPVSQHSWAKEWCRQLGRTATAEYRRYLHQDYYSGFVWYKGTVAEKKEAVVVEEVEEIAVELEEARAPRAPRPPAARERQGRRATHSRTHTQRVWQGRGLPSRRRAADASERGRPEARRAVPRSASQRADARASKSVRRERRPPAHAQRHEANEANAAHQGHSQPVRSKGGPGLSRRPRPPSKHLGAPGAPEGCRQRRLPQQRQPSHHHPPPPRAPQRPPDHQRHQTRGASGQRRRARQEDGSNDTRRTGGRRRRGRTGRGHQPSAAPGQRVRDRQAEVRPLKKRRPQEGVRGRPQTPLLTTLPLVGVPQGGPQTRSPTPYPPAGDPQYGPQSRYPYDVGAGATARPPHANPRAAAQHQRRAVSTPSLGLVGGSDAR